MIIIICSLKAVEKKPMEMKKENEYNSISVEVKKISSRWVIMT